MVGIYRIRNKLNGKVYIGQSWYVEERVNSHFRSKENTHFYNSIRKYGKENFEVDVLCECNNQKELDFAEDAFIEYYGGPDSDRNYNRRGGGSTGKLSKDTKNKLSNITTKQMKDPYVRKLISESNKKYWKNNSHLKERMIGDNNPMANFSEWSEERREQYSNRMREATSGEKNGFFGKKHSKEVRDKLSKANKGRKHKPRSQKYREKISKRMKGREAPNKIKISNEEINRMKELHKEGISMTSIANQINKEFNRSDIKYGKVQRTLCQI